MDYKVFKETFAKDLKERLYKRGIEDISMSFYSVQMPNRSYEALTVCQGDSDIGLNLNIEKIFAEYKRIGNYGRVIEESTLAIVRGMENAPSVDAAEVANYDVMKKKLSIEVISAETNAELLKKIPHENMEDIAVVYRFIIDSNETGRVTTLVTNGWMDYMGVSYERLKADALENAPKIRPVVIQGMNEIMRKKLGEGVFEMFGISERKNEIMYEATVPDKICGAGVLAYQGFMDQAAEKLGGDFYILPSSIHEILLVPDDGEKVADTLRDMVQETNAKDLSPENKLTDNVYHYDAKEHIFELAEKFEARQ